MHKIPAICGDLPTPGQCNIAIDSQPRTQARSRQQIRFHPEPGLQSFYLSDRLNAPRLLALF